MTRFLICRWMGIGLAMLPATIRCEKDGELLVLAPFVVDTQIPRDTSWRYASIPGYEILSQCSDDVTVEVVAALWRGRLLALPPEMRPEFTVPMTVVIFDHPFAMGAPPSMGTMKKPGEMHNHLTNVIKRVLPDRESFSINLYHSDFRYSPTFRFDVITLLQAKVPPPPLWLNEGLFGGYGLYRESIGLDRSETTKNVAPSSWCSRTELKECVDYSLRGGNYPPLNRRHLAPSPLIRYIPSLKTIFEEAPPNDENDHARWRATAALFIRWGIYAHPEQTQSFWSFARAACSEPVSEEMFQRHIGRSYREVERELSWYIAIALSSYAEAPANLPPMPKVSLAPAKISEVARVLGEWERIEANVLEAKLPDVAKNYREHAAERLQRAYDRGVQHPQLLSTLGLLMLDSGNEIAARKYLDEATANDALGPRPYLELAHLLWRDALASDREIAKRPTWEKIADLLLRAERQAPPARVTYSMLAELMRYSSTRKEEQDAALRRGLIFFPRDVALKRVVNDALHAASKN